MVVAAAVLFPLFWFLVTSVRGGIVGRKKVEGWALDMVLFIYVPLPFCRTSLYFESIKESKSCVFLCPSFLAR